MVGRLGSGGRRAGQRLGDAVDLGAGAGADVVQRQWRRVVEELALLLDEGELAGETTPLARQVLDPADVQPGPLEDPLALDFAERG
ncbi:hypothetical protein ACFWAN_04060 [Streptomyces mirabilis]|uniref:hypothetical protein n=1 Tax=Streptomyces mirabilis TaxID=68239 RepID=UPI0036574B15